MNKLPFPKIDPYVFDREGLKECYVFKPKNPEVENDCPTIIHFVLANINFRKYKAPGVFPWGWSLTGNVIVPTLSHAVWWQGVLLLLWQITVTWEPKGFLIFYPQISSSSW